MFWEDNVRKVVPYVPGEQPKEKDIIKLNTNENPYGPSPRIKELISDPELLKKYPDPAAELLVDAIADYHGVKSENVFTGVGSDDVLAMIFMTFFNSERPILFPDITYSFYPVWAELFNIPYETKPLDKDFCIVKEDYMVPNGGIIFPNPNAPTGIFMPLSDVRDILDANRESIVVIDEAYVDFADESALTLLESYDNLIVVRTFSKSRSLAGLRIGYAIASEKIISYIKDVKYSYNSYTMNTPSIVIGTESVKDDEYFKETTAKVIKTREWFSAELESMGFSVLPSKTNFVFASYPGKDGEEIFEYLKKCGIYVRHFGGERIKDYLRITIGTDSDMQTLANALKKYLTED